MEGGAQVTSAMDRWPALGAQHLSPGLSREVLPSRGTTAHGSLSPCSDRDQGGAGLGARKIFSLAKTLHSRFLQKASIIKERFIMGNQAGPDGLQSLGLYHHCYCPTAPPGPPCHPVKPPAGIDLDEKVAGPGFIQH